MSRQLAKKYYNPEILVPSEFAASHFMVYILQMNLHVCALVNVPYHIETEITGLASSPHNESRAAEWNRKEGIKMLDEESCAPLFSLYTSCLWAGWSVQHTRPHRHTQAATPGTATELLLCSCAIAAVAVHYSMLQSSSCSCRT